MLHAMHAAANLWPMVLIDTHCHLTHSRLREQLQQVLDRARKAGVEVMICASADIAESSASLELAAEHVGIYATCGVHPHEAAKAIEQGESFIDALRPLLAEPRCVALGEIGLDYHYDSSPRQQQRQAFEMQLGLASEISKPIVIHTREAFEDTLAIIASSGIDGRRFIFHSFTEGPAATQRVLEMGAAISFSGIVTFKNASDLQASARLVPGERLLVETDSPYLSPEPVRKMKTNEPANVAHVLRFLAHLRDQEPATLANQVLQNARRMFGLPE